MAENTQDFSLETIVSTAISVPGVKVNRNAFLADCFKNVDVDIHEILDLGPVEANCSREMLSKMANNLVVKRTSESSLASFVAGLPGGFAMGISIPVDVLQYFAVALRLAQELSYLYGAEDLWQNGELDSNRVNNQLILYCGVMFGVSGAANGVRLLSAQLAKTAAKKIPQKALTKTFWYPIVKNIGKVLSIKVTKSTVAKGISKAIPVIGGVVSGSITFASMLPMGKRLAATLDDATFDYSEEEIDEDIAVIEAMTEENESEEQENEKKTLLKENAEKVTQNLKSLGKGMGDMLSNVQRKAPKISFPKRKATDTTVPSEEDVFDKLEKLSKLHDMGVITQEEFDSKKAELLSKI